jgi:hypothetical protein
MVIAWGDDLTMIYNDGYRAMLGTEKIRDAMGAGFRDVWSEVWDTIGPMVDSVMTTGRPSWAVDTPLVMRRSGYVEETHFTFSYSPLRDDNGVVRGLFDMATETTHEVIDRRRLRLLSELSTALHLCDGDPVDLLRVASDALFGKPDVQGADLYLRSGERVELVASTEARPPPSRILAARVATTLQSRSVRIRGRTLVAPLVGAHGREAVGVVVVEASPLRPFDYAYQSFLSLVASTIGAAVARAVDRRREVDQVRGVSDALQLAMLPGQPVARGWFTRYRPADGSLAVGGDWYDVAELPGGRWGLLVGDCVGQGLAAAALMGQLRSAGRALLLEGNGPASALEGLDRFARTLPGAEFTTVFCGIVDEPAGTLTYASAGHPPGLRVGREGATWLDEAAGFPLALGEEPRRQRTIALDSGDVVVLYTDGLVERRHESLQVGLARLAGTAEEILRVRPAEDLADALLAALADGARDDVALVVYRSGE